MKKYPDSTCVHWRPVMWLRHRHWPFCMEQLQRRRAELMVIAILSQLQLRSQVFIALKKKKRAAIAIKIVEMSLLKSYSDRNTGEIPNTVSTYIWRSWFSTGFWFLGAIAWWFRTGSSAPLTRCPRLRPRRTRSPCSRSRRGWEPSVPAARREGNRVNEASLTQIKRKSCVLVKLLY